jgi:acyl-CoA thioesterase-1
MTVNRMARILRCLLAVLPLVAAACGSPDATRTDGGAEVRGAEVRGAEVWGAEVRGSGGAAVRTPERPVAPRRIVFLGDSLTAGLGLLREQSVSSLIQERLTAEGYSYEVVNAGVSGDTSAGGLSRLDWSLDGDVEVLVIELGANDGLRGLPVAQMKDNLDEIITRAKARDITVILTGMEAPPNYGPLYTAEFRKAFRDLADDHDVTFVPFYLTGVAGIASLNQRDGIHPNVEGSRVIAEMMWQALEPLLDKDR